MPCLSPTQEPMKQFANIHKMRSLCCILGITPFSSHKLIPFSMARDIVRTVMSSRRWPASIVMANAEMNPATGALTLSVLPKRRLIKQSVSLYAALKNIKKSPNLVQSCNVLFFFRFLRSLAGLISNIKFLKSNWMPNPIKKFLEHFRIVFSKHPLWCWHAPLLLSKASGSKWRTMVKIE